MESVFVSHSTAKGEEWKLRLTWKLYWACALACLTCLADRYFYEELLTRCWNVFCGLAVLLVKILAVITFPFAGLVIALVTARENRKTVARNKPGRRKFMGGQV